MGGPIIKRVKIQSYTFNSLVQVNIMFAHYLLLFIKIFPDLINFRIRISFYIVARNEPNLTNIKNLRPGMSYLSHFALKFYH